MSLDRLALNAISRLDPTQGKGAAAAKSSKHRPPERLPPGRHRLLFHAAPQAILLVDPKGHIVDANDEAVRLTGWSKGELRRTTFNALVVPRGKAGAPAMLRPWVGNLQGGDGCRREVRVLQGRPLGEKSGPRPYYLSDLSAEQDERDRGRALDAVDALRAFSHGLGLELSNRLTALVGHVDMLGAVLGKDGVERDRFRDVARTLDGLDALTRALGVLGRSEPARLETVDLAAWFLSLEEKLKGALPVSVRLEVDLEGAATAVSADTVLLARAIFALLHQAADAMPKGGQFGILAVPSASPDRVVLEVRDTGAPLGAEGAARVFVPFAPIRTDGRDAGFDLATARFLLARSGVDLKVDETVEDGLGFQLVFRPANLMG